MSALFPTHSGFPERSSWNAFLFLVINQSCIKWYHILMLSYLRSFQFTHSYNIDLLLYFHKFTMLKYFICKFKMVNLEVKVPFECKNWLRFHNATKLNEVHVNTKLIFRAFNLSPDHWGKKNPSFQAQLFLV